MIDTKDTNPKDAVGVRKAPISTMPLRVLAGVGLALLEGARKYGRHNYRVAGARASVYLDAVIMGHLATWWEGEDIDPDSGLNHIDKAIAGLFVLRDSMLAGNWTDDRPPRAKDGWRREANELAGQIIDRYPNALPPFTELGQHAITRPPIPAIVDPAEPASLDEEPEVGDYVTVTEIHPKSDAVRNGVHVGNTYKLTLKGDLGNNFFDGWPLHSLDGSVGFAVRIRKANVK